ncbi:MAG TPA: CYTH domain-containing protein [Ktedonobacteraceae bacterium]|jgi:adenylate cyclase class IV|nr:CYTH domain-containing protein [Ktedonobacteraceae bacterium]
MIEVELKFAITPDSRARLERNLRTCARCLHNSDVYYDTPSFDLLGQAVFVRVRNQQRLEFKFNEQAAPAHLFCTERTFSLAAGPEQIAEMNKLFAEFLPRWQAADTIDGGLDKNSLIELARIENQRAEYHYENMVVCVDHVEGLGDFLEIETQCEEESETPQAIERIQAFAAGLEARQVHIGYVELWLQKYHPLAYRQGKYQEEYFSIAYPLEQGLD